MPRKWPVSTQDQLEGRQTAGNQTGVSRCRREGQKVPERIDRQANLGAFFSRWARSQQARLPLSVVERTARRYRIADCQGSVLLHIPQRYASACTPSVGRKVVLDVPRRQVGAADPLHSVQHRVQVILTLGRLPGHQGRVGDHEILHFDIDSREMVHTLKPLISNHRQSRWYEEGP